jgi:hypothetical protein
VSAKRRESTRTASYERNADAIRTRRVEKAKDAAERAWWRKRRVRTRAAIRLGVWQKPGKGSKGTKRKRKRIRERFYKRDTENT